MTPKRVVLTALQKQALAKLVRIEWRSAYSIGVSLKTLDELYSKGYAERIVGIGAYYSPRTAIQFRRKAKLVLEVE